MLHNNIKHVCLFKVVNIEYVWWWWWWWWWSFRVPSGLGYLTCHPRWFLGLRLSPLMVEPHRQSPTCLHYSPLTTCSRTQRFNSTHPKTTGGPSSISSTISINTIPLSENPGTGLPLSPFTPQLPRQKFSNLSMLPPLNPLQWTLILLYLTCSSVFAKIITTLANPFVSQCTFPLHFKLVQITHVGFAKIFSTKY